LGAGIKDIRWSRAAPRFADPWTNLAAAAQEVGAALRKESDVAAVFVSDMIVDAPPGRKGKQLCGQIFLGAGRGDIQALFAKCLAEALGKEAPPGLSIGAVVFRRPVVVAGAPKRGKKKSAEPAVSNPLFMFTVARSPSFVDSLQKVVLTDIGPAFDGAALTVVAHSPIVSCQNVGRCGYRREEGFVAQHSTDDGSSECQFNALAERGRHEMRCEILSPSAASSAAIEARLNDVLVSGQHSQAVLAKNGRTVDVVQDVDSLPRGKVHTNTLSMKYLWRLNGDVERLMDTWLKLPLSDAAQYKDLLRPLFDTLPARLPAPTCDSTWRVSYLR
jgi:hypothetical protein